MQMHKGTLLIFLWCIDRKYLAQVLKLRVAPLPMDAFTWHRNPLRRL